MKFFNSPQGGSRWIL